MAYRAMLDASVKPTGDWGYGALRDKARAIARELDKQESAPPTWRGCMPMP